MTPFDPPPPPLARRRRPQMVWPPTGHKEASETVCSDGPLCQGHAEMAGGSQTHRRTDLPEQIPLRGRPGGHAEV